MCDNALACSYYRMNIIHRSLPADSDETVSNYTTTSTPQNSHSSSDSNQLHESHAFLKNVGMSEEFFYCNNTSLHSRSCFAFHSKSKSKLFVIDKGVLPLQLRNNVSSVIKKLESVGIKHLLGKNICWCVGKSFHSDTYENIMVGVSGHDKDYVHGNSSFHIANSKKSGDYVHFHNRSKEMALIENKGKWVDIVECLLKCKCRGVESLFAEDGVHPITAEETSSVSSSVPFDKCKLEFLFYLKSKPDKYKELYDIYDHYLQDASSLWFGDDVNNHHHFHRYVFSNVNEYEGFMLRLFMFEYLLKGYQVVFLPYFLKLKMITSQQYVSYQQTVDQFLDLLIHEVGYMKCLHQFCRCGEDNLLTSLLEKHTATMSSGGGLFDKYEQVLLFSMQYTTKNEIPTTIYPPCALCKFHVLDDIAHLLQFDDSNQITKISELEHALSTTTTAQCETICECGERMWKL
jgi:hypothetical protein